MKAIRDKIKKLRYPYYVYREIMKKKEVMNNGHQMSPLMVLVGSFLMQSEIARHKPRSRSWRPC